MIFSEEQNESYDQVKDTDDNLIINSCPGSGKTTTILKCAIPALRKKGLKDEDILVLMFSKPIQLEFDAKAKELGMKVKVSTFHGIGFGLLASKFGTTYEADKLKRIGKTLGINDYSIFNLVRSGKDRGVNLFPDKKGTKFWRELAEELELDLDDTDFLKAEKLFQVSVADIKTCDYSDMQFLPVYYKLSLKKYKAICLDESQD